MKTYGTPFPSNYGRIRVLLRPVVAGLFNARGLNTQQERWRSTAAAATDEKHVIVRRRISKDERRTMVESFVNEYRAMNAGKFPSAKHAQKQVGGSYYVIREILQELEYNSKITHVNKFLLGQKLEGAEISTYLPGSQMVDTKSQVNYKEDLDEDVHDTTSMVYEKKFAAEDVSSFRMKDSDLILDETLSSIIEDGNEFSADEVSNNEVVVNGNEIAAEDLTGSQNMADGDRIAVEDVSHRLRIVGSDDALATDVSSSQSIVSSSSSDMDGNEISSESVSNVQIVVNEDVARSLKVAGNNETSAEDVTSRQRMVGEDEVLVKDASSIKRMQDRKELSIEDIPGSQLTMDGDAVRADDSCMPSSHLHDGGSSGVLQAHEKVEESPDVDANSRDKYKQGAQNIGSSKKSSLWVHLKSFADNIISAWWKH